MAGWGADRPNLPAASRLHGSSINLRGPGVCTVTASQAGDKIYEDAEPVAHPFSVGKAPTGLSAVKASATYGDTTAVLTATLKRPDTGKALPDGTVVTFTFRGQTYTSTTAGGVATKAVPLAPTNAGTYSGAVQASYAGSASYQAANAGGPLAVAKRILWVKPKNQARAANAANPGCLSVNDLELVTPAPAGTGLINGDTLAGSVTFASGWGCTYGVTGGTPTKPSKPGNYTITATGVLSANYDIRYKPGTLTVTP
jgi:hypothetical protein